MHHASQRAIASASHALQQFNDLLLVCGVALFDHNGRTGGSECIESLLQSLTIVLDLAGAGGEYDGCGAQFDEGLSGDDAESSESARDEHSAVTVP